MMEIFYKKIKQIQKIVDIGNIDLTLLEKIRKEDVKNGDIVVFDYTFGRNVFNLGFIFVENGFFQLKTTSTSWRCDFNHNIPLYKFNFSLINGN